MTQRDKPTGPRAVAARGRSASAPTCLRGATRKLSARLYPASRGFFTGRAQRGARLPQGARDVYLPWRSDSTGRGRERLARDAARARGAMGGTRPPSAPSRSRSARPADEDDPHAASQPGNDQDRGRSPSLSAPSSPQAAGSWRHRPRQRHSPVRSGRARFLWSLGRLRRHAGARFWRCRAAVGSSGATPVGSLVPRRVPPRAALASAPGPPHARQAGAPRSRPLGAPGTGPGRRGRAAGRARAPVAGRRAGGRARACRPGGPRRSG